MAFGMNFFRRHSGKMLVILVALLMVSWLAAGPLMRLMTPETTRGTLFGEPVTEYRYASAASALHLLRGAPVSQDDVWTFLAVLHEADRLGVKVTGEEITAAVRDWVAMLTRGREADLNAAYETVLTRYRVTDEFVRAAWRKHLRAAKVREIFGGAFHVTEAEKWLRFKRMRLKVAVKKLRLAVADFTDAVVPPTEDELRSYFDGDPEAYLIRPRVEIAYIAIMDEDIPDLVEVTEQDIEDYYQERKVDEFLLPLEEQDLDGRAEETAPTDSDLDLAPDALEPTDAALSPAPEDLQPTASQVAPESDEPLYRPLEEVADEIRAKLREREINAVLADIHADYLLQETKDLPALAERYGLECTLTGPVSAGDEQAVGPLAQATTSSGLTVLEQVFQQAPSMEEFPSRSLGEARSDEGRFLYAVLSYEPERQPGFEEVAEQVRRDYIEREAGKLALKKAAELKARVETQGWQALQQGWAVEEMTFAGDWPSPELVEAAASVETGGFGGPLLSGGEAHFFEVKRRIEPTWDEFQEAQAAEQRLAPLVMQFGADTVAQYFAETELEKQVAAELERIREERREFIRRWERDLLERAAITTREQSEPPEAASLPEEL